MGGAAMTELLAGDGYYKVSISTYGSKLAMATPR